MINFLCLFSLAISLVSGSKFVYEKHHRLVPRQLSFCSANGAYTAGNGNPNPSLSPIFNQSGDSFLETFVSPTDGWLCHLSIGIANLSTAAQFNLSIYDNTTAQTDIVNGTAIAIANSTTL